MVSGEVVFAQQYALDPLDQLEVQIAVKEIVEVFSQFSLPAVGEHHAPSGITKSHAAVGPQRHHSARHGAQNALVIIAHVPHFFE